METSVIHLPCIQFLVDVWIKDTHDILFGYCNWCGYRAYKEVQALCSRSFLISAFFLSGCFSIIDLNHCVHAVRRCGNDRYTIHRRYLCLNAALRKCSCRDFSCKFQFKLLLIVFAISTLLLAGVASKNASIEVQDKTRQAIGAGFLLERNAEYRTKRVREYSEKIGNDKEGSFGGYHQEKEIINGVETWTGWTSGKTTNIPVRLHFFNSTVKFFIILTSAFYWHCPHQS